MKDPKLKIALLSMMRLNSTRIERKLLEKVGSTPLATKALEILKTVRGRDFEILAAINPQDQELISIAERCRVRVIFRSNSSREAQNLEDSLDIPLRESLKDSFTWVLAVNPSMPFLKADTIEKAILRIQGGETSCFQSAYKERGLVWDQAGRRLVGPGLNPIYYAMCPALWAYPVVDLGDKDRMLIKTLLPVHRGPEFLDVGHTEDLQIAQVWSKFLKDSYEPKTNRT